MQYIGGDPDPDSSWDSGSSCGSGGGGGSGGEAIQEGEPMALARADVYLLDPAIVGLGHPQELPEIT